MQEKTAVVLVNLGTPDRPAADAIRRYLKEFLSDERVVDFPRWLWLPILNFIILRTRPPKLVEKYALVWGRFDGPIRNISNALAHRIRQELPALQVEVAMTYGAPSLKDVLHRVKDASRLLILPMFPQYAGATTGAVRDALARALALQPMAMPIDVIEDYSTDAGYIEALADSIRRSQRFRQASPMVIFSFHGIPMSQHRSGDPYADQCRATAALVAAQLDLPPARWRVTFQSRFGPFPWLQPYTDITMTELPGQGIKDVLVVCPGFSVDCLETIEEIRVLNRELFLAAGGEHFNYVRALNASRAHARLLANLINSRLEQG